MKILVKMVSRDPFAQCVKKGLVTAAAYTVQSTILFNSPLVGKGPGLNVDY